MYFPENMDFNYFFFSTYVGYFFEALPIALFVGIIYGIITYRKNNNILNQYQIARIVFVTYITGLVCLVLGLDLMRSVYYPLIYHMDSGIEIRWFTWNANFNPDFMLYMNSQTIGNLMMFMPFGILYPLTKKEMTWKEVLFTGIIFSAGIEILQPVLGRSFDINDIIMNSLGVLIATFIFFFVREYFVWKKENGVVN